MINENFAENLKRIRKERKLTQEELSRKTNGINIAHLELGKRKPNFYSLIKIADSLNVSIDSLVKKNSRYLYEGLTSEQVNTINILIIRFKEINGVNDYED